MNFFSKEKMKEFNSKDDDDDDGFWIKRTETDAKKNTKPSSIIEPREKN